jgi:hypothetical protein
MTLLSTLHLDFLQVGGASIKTFAPSLLIFDAKDSRPLLTTISFVF